MLNEVEKMEKAKDIIIKIASGTNPVNGLPIENESFLHDPRIIRCFYYIAEVLENVTKGNYNKKIDDFIITDEQKSQVKFTEGNIGVNEVAKCINEQINTLVSKKVTGVLLNKGLKRLGILTEMEEEGSRRTTTNNISKKYGFFLDKRNYNGKEYDMVVIDDIGKKYILDNIENIMG